MGTQDDIDRLKAEENRAKGRLGYVEKEYRELGGESRAGKSASDLEARDQEIGELASAHNNLENTINVREAERHELERGRDAANKQAGVPPREAGVDDAPPPQPGQPSRPLDASQDAPVLDASSDAQPSKNAQPQLEDERHGLDQNQQPAPSPPELQSQSGPSPEAASAGRSPAAGDAQQSTTPPEKKPVSNLEPFEPPAPEGYFIGRSRERADRFFKPVDDVERMKAEQGLCEHYQAEATKAKEAIDYQRQRADEEMKKLDLDQKGMDEFRKNEFELQKVQLNTLYQDQKQELQEVHALTQVADETLREEQSQKREDAQRALDNHWFEVTYRVCEPPARQAVREQYAGDIAGYDARLDREGTSPEEKEAKLGAFEARLQSHEPADVHMTTLLLQKESFPEIVANGPQFILPGPSVEPQGPSVPAIPPPQQSGPQGPSF